MVPRLEWLQGMWDLPGSGIELSSALAEADSSTTEPAGSPPFILYSWLP